MKYMHFNSSCSYAGLANLLALQGLETEDYQIALDMGLPYFLRYEEVSGVYVNGPMLQSAEWFDLYLKPRGFRYIERFMKKQEAVEQLCFGSMLGLQVTPKSKHAVIFLGKEDGVYKFLNNKREDSEEPDELLLSKEQCLERLPEQVVIGYLEPCEPKAADVRTYLQESLKNWEKLRKDLLQFISQEQTPQTMKEAMNRLFRPLLLDGLSMAKLLEKKELENRLTQLQKQFLGIVRKNETVKPDSELDGEEIDEAIAAFVDMIRLQSIRESEGHSHTELYSGEELYKEGSWLNKPIKSQGVVCLVMNSEVKEKNKETGENLFPQFEVNLPTEELQEILQNAFEGWEVLKSTVREQQYDIPREGCISELETNVVTFVARKGR